MARWAVHYMLKDGKPSRLFVEDDLRLSEQQVIELAKRQDPQINFTRAERVWEHAHAVREVSFHMWTQGMVDFVVSLVFKGCRLYLEVRNHGTLEDIRDKYRSLTGEELVEEPGVFHVAPDSAGKWGNEGSIFYDKGIEFPSADFGAEPEKPGQVNSIPLFWSLVRMGFRVGRNRRTDAVLEAVPEDMLDKVPDGCLG